jgi:hypothetical protein
LVIGHAGIKTEKDGSLTITMSYAEPSGLQIHINNLAILVYCLPKIVLLAIDLHEDFINEEGITIPSVFPLQSSSIQSAELDAPEAD